MDNKTNWLDYDVDEMVRGDRDYLWHHIKPHKVFQTAEQMIIVEGKGLRVKDIRGREYLDATSGGVWSVMVGHGRDSIAAAVYEQLKILSYYAGTVGNIPGIKFAAKLIELLPRLSKVFFSNSGSEANEKAFKVVNNGVQTYDVLVKKGDLKHFVAFDKDGNYIKKADNDVKAAKESLKQTAPVDKPKVEEKKK